MRVFWIMDNGSAHRGQKAAQRIRSRWPIATLGATYDLAWRERFFDYQMPKNIPQATDCDYLHS